MREAVSYRACGRRWARRARALRETRPDDMAAAAIKEALARVPALKPEMVEDVILGCAMPEAEQGITWPARPRSSPASPTRRRP